MTKVYLLQIIKSLSKNEKTTFNFLMKAQHKNKPPNFLKLYDWYIRVLDKNLSDNEIKSKLEQFLKRNPSINKDIISIKKQLKDKILHSLSIDAEENYKVLDVPNLIKIIKNLIEKKLFEEAQKQIKRAKNKSKDLNLNSYLVELNDIELKLLGKQSLKHDHIKQSELIEELEKYNGLYTLELDLKNIFRKLDVIAQKDPLLTIEKNVKTFKIAYRQFETKVVDIEKHKANEDTHIVYWFHRIQNLYFRSIGKLEDALQNSKTLVEYFESNPEIIEHLSPLYVKSICGLTRTCSRKGEYKILQEGIQKVKYLYESIGNEDALEATCDIGVLHYLNTKQYNEADKLANFIKEKWKGIKEKSVDGKLLWYCKNNMLLYWVLNKNKKFEYWLDKGLYISRPYKGKAFYLGIRMFQLINFFEQSEWEILKSNINALRKTLDNNENLSSFEQIVLSYFKKFYNVHKSNKNINLNLREKKLLKKKTFEHLKEELQNLEFKKTPRVFGCFRSFSNHQFFDNAWGHWVLV